MNKLIFHIDINSAFLSFSAIKMLSEGCSYDIREVPAIVGGDRQTRHGVVLAKSITAKEFGINTGEPIATALRKCPGLIIVPTDFEFYHSCSRRFCDILRSYCPVVEQVSIDECFLDFTSVCHDYESPIAAATLIKDHIRDELGFTVNVGISDVKVLAKMASDFQKPDRIHTLYRSEIKSKMWPLPVSDLLMVGKSSASTLRKLGIITIGDLANYDIGILSSHLKSHGKLIYNYANGIDDSPVCDTPSELKGIGNSTTLSEDITTREAALRVILSLCDQVARRLRADNAAAYSICVEIKYSDFTSVSHQMQSVSAVNDSTTLYSYCIRLFDELWNNSPIRLLGVRTTKLIREDEPVQMTIFDYQQNNTSKKNTDLDRALDSINERFGNGSIMRASRLIRDEE